MRKNFLLLGMVTIILLCLVVVNNQQAEIAQLRAENGSLFAQAWVAQNQYNDLLRQVGLARLDALIERVEPIERQRIW